MTVKSKLFLGFVYYNADVNKIIHIIESLIKIKKDYDIKVFYSSMSPVYAFDQLSFKFVKHNNLYLDWSGYINFLQIIKNNNFKTFIIFNDTLGTYRYFGKSFYIWIKLSFLFIDLGIFNIAAPFDRNNEYKWICSYFILGNSKLIYKKYSLKYAKKFISTSESNQINYWVEKNWRNRHKIKLKKNKINSIYFEKSFARFYDISHNKIFKFDKISLFRIFNSIERRIFDR